MTGETCPKCGNNGELGRGYGEQSVFTCADCGNEWVEESSGGSHLQ